MKTTSAPDLTMLAMAAYNAIRKDLEEGKIAAAKTDQNKPEPKREGLPNVRVITI